MVWKLRADCTYTTTANKTTRQSAVESLIASYPEASTPTFTGRFPGGVTSQSTTRFTVSYDFNDSDGSIAQACFAALQTSLATSAKSQTLVSLHRAG